MKRKMGETYQKILAELTGVGVNLNIFVFRLRSLYISLVTSFPCIMKEIERQLQGKSG